MKLAKLNGLDPVARLVVIALAGALGGCSSFTTLHTARPLPPGEVEYVGALSVYAFEDTVDDNVYVPSFEFAARRGFTERIDAGLKLSSLAMLHADVNYALYQSDSFALSIDPTVSALSVSGTSVFYFWLPVLMDLIVTETTTLTLTTRYGYMDLEDFADSDDVLGLDASTGLIGIGLGLRHRFPSGKTVLPEFIVAFPTDDTIHDDAILSLSFGIVF